MTQQDKSSYEDRDDQLVAEVSSSDLATQLEAIESIVLAPTTMLSDAALDALITCVGAERKVVQRRAIEALAAMAKAGDTRVRAALERALVSANRRARFGAAYALAQLGDENLAFETLDALAEALGDDDGDIRWAASVLIVQLGRQHPAAIRERMTALAGSGNPNARKMALYCIRDLGFSGTDLLTLLETAAGDSSVHIRLAALSVLAKLDDDSGKAAAITLARLESDPDAGVRRAAAVAVGQVRGSTSGTLPALKIAAANATDPALARAAKSALERLEKR